MTNTDYLNVWYGDELVGILFQDEIGRMSFCYEDTWCQHGFAISQQLPVTIKEYKPDIYVSFLGWENTLAFRRTLQ